jgi:hypothetical protein
MNRNGKQQKAEHIRRLIVGIVTKSGHDVKVSLPSLLREAIREKLWTQLRKADGSKYRNAVEWLEDGLPNGCLVGIDRAYFSRDEITSIIKDLGESETIRSVLKVLESSRSRRNGKAGKSTSADRSSAHNRPESSLDVVLQRDYPDYWQGYLNGTYRSVYAAAVAAGIKKDGHDPLQRMKAYWRRATDKQRREFRNWVRTAAARQ